MVVTDYLDRIGFQQAIQIDVATLKELHKCHVLSIPFEDLDIHLQKPIQLELQPIYHKVIRKGRGGFCYELNYLFCELLKQLGFNSKIISSRIYDEQEVLGPAFDHMSIVVTLESEWLLDVGYGDLFIFPVKIEDIFISKDWFKTYKVNQISDTCYILSEAKDGATFIRRYVFDTTPRQIEDFYEQSHYKQYSKDSYFVKNRICTLPTTNGRMSLINDKVIEKVNGIRSEYTIYSETEFYQLLYEKFHINLEKEI